MSLFQAARNIFIRNLISSQLLPLHRRCCSTLTPDNSSKNTQIATKDSQESKKPQTITVEDRPDRTEYISSIENEFDYGVQISSYNVHGFRINKYVQVIGPVIVFPKTVFSWNVRSLDFITPDSLSIFRIVEPKVETLIIGAGEHEPTAHLGKTILAVSHELKINIEILSIELACSQFNFLSSEGRMVAAALIPPQDLRFCEDDIFGTHAVDGRLFTDKNIHLPKEGNFM